MSFTVGNITYTIDTISTVSVTNSTAYISSIPSTALSSVTNNGTPYTVTSIGNGAFFNRASLAGALTIGASVTYIGTEAFSYCTALTGALTIPASVIYIGNSAFRQSNITALTIGASVTYMGEAAFLNCVSLTGALTIPASVTSIGISTFYGCTALSGPLTIGAGVTSIGQSAFYGCTLLSIYKFLGNAPTNIGSNIFDGGPDPAATIDYTIGKTGWTGGGGFWPPLPYIGTRLATVAVCLLKNTKVLMADNTYGNIQDIKTGEYIRGAFSGLPKQIKSVSHRRLYYDALNANNMPCKIPKHFFCRLTNAHRRRVHVWRALVTV